jgi:hypothetical protein
VTVEDVNYINDLDPTRPRGSDKISLGDDHIRNIKKSLTQTFPNIDGEVTATDEELNALDGVDTSQPIQDALDNTVKLTGDQTIDGKKTFEQELSAFRVKLGDTKTIFSDGDCGLMFTTGGGGEPQILGLSPDGGLSPDQKIDIGRAANPFDKIFSDNFIGENANITNLKVDNADTTNFIGENADITNLKVDNADITNLNINGEDFNDIADGVQDEIDELRNDAVLITGDQKVDGIKTFEKQVVARRFNIGDGQTIHAQGNCGLLFDLNTDGSGLILGVDGNGAVNPNAELDLGRRTNYFDKAFFREVNTDVIKPESGTLTIDGDLDANNVDNYGHWTIAVLGEPTTDVTSGMNVFFEASGGTQVLKSGNRIRYTSPDHSQEISGLQDAIADLQAQIDKTGGGMITVAQQPTQAGNFVVRGTDQTYRADVAVGNGLTKTLLVPDGMVFCFEYLFGIGGGTLRVDIDQIYIDGVRVYSTNQGSFDYDSNGGSAWPGTDRGPLLKVKEKLEIKGLNNFVSNSELCLAGFFAEA